MNGHMHDCTPETLKPAARIVAAMTQLTEAHQYAVDAGRDVWDFAVEIHALRAVDLTTNDFRWLACKGYVEHAQETTRPGAEKRSFRPDDEVRFSNKSCFVLTKAGLALAEAILRDVSPGSRGAAGNGSEPALPEICPGVPVWDPLRRELRMGGKLVKQFKLPSPNQERVLIAFEEEGWPPRIDDPLSRNGCPDHKRRLHDTIKSLNRHQKHRLIRIKGDGTGEGVLWEQMARG